MPRMWRIIRRLRGRSERRYGGLHTAAVSAEACGGPRPGGCEGEVNAAMAACAPH